MHKLAYIFIGLILFLNSPAYAEIQFIRLKWNPTACNATCNQLLEKGLRGIHGVTDIQYNAGFGEATLSWNPTTAFSFQPVNNAMRMVGPGLISLDLKLRGTITHEGTQLYINSLGDGTRFKLLGPMKESTNTYVMRGSELNFPLTPELRDRLFAAEKGHEVVTIEGELFSPNSFLLRLIISNISYTKDESNVKSH